MKDKSIYVRVTVYAGRKRDVIRTIGPDRYEIETKAPAERNLANHAVREKVAVQYGVPVSNVRLVSGHQHSHKICSVILPE